MQDGPHSHAIHSRVGRFFFPALFVLLIAVVALLSTVHIREKDRRMRAELLRKATLTAWALRAEAVDRLTGTPADLAAPGYHRIKSYLMRARRIYPECRFLYILRKPLAGNPVFLVDSEPPDSEDYSPPGQPYDDASPELVQMFRTGAPLVEGPLADSWGSWVSALAPVFHPHNDRMVAVLGLDIDARHWRRATLPAALPDLLFGGAAALLLGLAWRGAAAARNRRPSVETRWWRRREVRLTAGLGLLASALAAQIAYARAHARQVAETAEKNTIHGSMLQQLMYRIGDNYLEGVARLFMGSDSVTATEFDTFVGHLLNRPYAHAWFWIPRVDAVDRENFEHAARSGGQPDFRIWQLDARGRPAPAGPRDDYLPVRHAAFAESHPDVIGFDHASDPALLEALRSAASNRSLAVTGPTPLGIGSAFTTPGLVVYRALWTAGASRPHGYVAAALRPDILLANALSRASAGPAEGREFFLFQLNGNRDPLYLASSHGGDALILAEPPTLNELEARGDAHVAPVLDFGAGFALVTVPDRRLYHEKAMDTARQSAGVGLLLTCLSAALANVLIGRRAALEAMVEYRTTALQDSEGSYRGLFNSIRQAIYIQDETGTFLDVNDGALAMYGYAREDFMGRTPEFLAAPGRNDLDALRQSFALAWSGQPQFFPFWGRRKDGREFPKDVWLSKGTYFGRDVLIAIAADVSDRHQAAAEQALLQQQLQQAQKLESVGRLAGGVAHDFNNMLQAILGFTGLAVEQNKDDTIGEYLAEIRRSAERSSDLTRQLLAFASRQTANPRVVDLNAVIELTIKMLRRLIGEDIRLDWKPGPDAGSINMDPTQMDQILANLVVNARDAIQDGGVITLETGTAVCTPECPCSRYIPVSEGVYAQIVVRDNGHGMDPDTLSHLFEPFFTTKTGGRGTGLGLATVFGIVKQNKGFLDVSSTPGAGTVFKIGFPRVAEAPPPDETAGRPAATLSGNETILLVEDEAAILRFGREFLTGLGYNVLSAGTPRQAVACCDAHDGPIHLLITDVVLPEMNGRELAEQLRRKRPSMRRMFMSGYTADIIASHGLLDRDIHFIAKPFSGSALAARIREILDGPPAA